MPTATAVGNKGLLNGKYLEYLDGIFLANPKQKQKPTGKHEL